jgi:spore coat protein A
MRKASQKLHADLPAAAILGYEGITPGPLIEVDYKQRIVVEWVNAIDAPFPILGAIDPPTALHDYPQDRPGIGAAGAVSDLSTTPIWNVVHLHGGQNPPDSDGWPENAFFKGMSLTAIYPSQPRGTLLWYHDHANMITRLNVYAGLAGAFIVRDDRERELAKDYGLPIGPPYEIPLIVQDRNLNLKKNGPKQEFDGQLLYKLAAPGAEFYGPYTLVNGKIWPRVEVEARPYRLRILNGSNARIYRLLLLKLKPDGSPDGVPTAANMTQIGGDSGLFMNAVSLLPPSVTKEGLTLAPAERADLILDLSPYAGVNVALINVEEAPLAPYQAPAPPTTPNPTPCDDPTPNDDHAPPDDLRWVLLFQVKQQPPSGPPLKKLPSTLSKDISVPATSPTTIVRQIILFEKPAGNLLINNRVFDDAIQETPLVDAVEIWEFYNLSLDTHPMHVHLVDFHVLERRKIDFVQSRMQYCNTDYTNWVPPAEMTLETATPPPGVKLLAETPQVDANERGPKDTVRVAPFERLRIVARYGPYTGKYVFHCHILEHEDMQMMRPFLVVPSSTSMPMGTMKMAGQKKRKKQRGAGGA